jgi:hypothetical protein
MQAKIIPTGVTYLVDHGFESRQSIPTKDVGVFFQPLQCCFLKQKNAASLCAEWKKVKAKLICLSHHQKM